MSPKDSGHSSLNFKKCTYILVCIKSRIDEDDDIQLNHSFKNIFLLSFKLYYVVNQSTLIRLLKKKGSLYRIDN